jgi:hypothetical protein
MKKKFEDGSLTFSVERKSFVVCRRQNVRGEFLTITEWSGVNQQRPNVIAVPLSGVEDLVEAIEAASRSAPSI